MRPILAAAAAYAALALASPAVAGVYTVSTPIAIGEYDIGTLVTLPQYGGPEKIKSVTVNLSGQTSAYGDYFHIADEGVFMPPVPVSWTLNLVGFDIEDSIGFASEFPAVFLAADQGDKRVYTPVFDADLTTAPDPFWFGSYAGAGNLDFILYPLISLTGPPPFPVSPDPYALFNGVLTMTIITAVPELDTWGLMLLGAFGTGGVLRRRRAATAAAGLASA